MHRPRGVQQAEMPMFPLKEEGPMQSLGPVTDLISKNLEKPWHNSKAFPPPKTIGSDGDLALGVKSPRRSAFGRKVGD